MNWRMLDNMRLSTTNCLHCVVSSPDTPPMDPGAAVMSRTPTRPVQVRLPEAADSFLSGLAHELGTTKTQIVIEALECLRKQRLERQMEAGYRELADGQAQIVEAGLAAGLPAVPD